jgi:hypothetical protein
VCCYGSSWFYAGIETFYVIFIWCIYLYMILLLYIYIHVYKYHILGPCVVMAAPGFMQVYCVIHLSCYISLIYIFIHDIYMFYINVYKYVYTYMNIVLLWLLQRLCRYRNLLFCFIFHVICIHLFIHDIYIIYMYV